MNAMNFISQRLQMIKPSPSIAANDLVNKLRAEGKDIINFTIGEPDFDTPEHIMQAAIEAMRKGDTHYTNAAGTVAVRQAISEKLKRDNQLDYSINEIVCGSGGKPLIFHAFAATLDVQDEVIIHAPYWVSYPDLATLNDATPVVIEGRQDNGFKLTAEDLAPAITEKTRWVVLNYPNNPTGAVYSKQELEALAELLRKHPHVLIMLDEIYEFFVYDDYQHISLAQIAPDLKDRILIINGASKGYAMTGWRIGYAAGPEWLIKAMTKLISQTTTCPSSVSQAAAVAAFVGDQQPIYDMLEIYKTRRQRVVELLQQISVFDFEPPQGAFYVFANIAGLIGKTTPQGQVIQSDADVVEYLLREGGVATVSGQAYGMSPFIRLSFASSIEVIEEGCQRIKNAVAKLA
ncbi:pyridoxal phosphate-dependent aminotransferase [Acinetobacter ursingii]|uniref:pyridoxal phosphate-dependent aminotransferase n=1 Tax=Acinetobacter ursingii TaxID=108980 RepID=UPI00124F6045|nr:pyridoxal phosphate-dependent aminotransferase [Acinetobacter ursingii]MCU4351278.1 pyridoxal phosphate-dependent aminotransferase [Acinetobacter ursingii]MDI3239552.1 pyridoxal phosphate-dependent aminotransferase [Acinetobacter ursingii]